MDPIFGLSKLAVCSPIFRPAGANLAVIDASRNSGRSSRGFPLPSHALSSLTSHRHGLPPPFSLEGLAQLHRVITSGWTLPPVDIAEIGSAAWSSAAPPLFRVAAHDLKRRPPQSSPWSSVEPSHLSVSSALGGLLLFLSPIKRLGNGLVLRAAGVYRHEGDPEEAQSQARPCLNLWDGQWWFNRDASHSFIWSPICISFWFFLHYVAAVWGKRRAGDRNRSSTPELQAARDSPLIITHVRWYVHTCQFSVCEECQLNWQKYQATL
jgi:hypothetical protein